MERTKNKKVLYKSNFIFPQNLQSLPPIRLKINECSKEISDDISNLKDEKNMTFLYRTPQYEMEPLNLTLIADRYSKLFGIEREKAMDMAIITKGYPFAYQAMGKYVWEESNHEVTDMVLTKFDEALSHYVYKKMWSELSEKDKWFMSFIVKKEVIPVSELLEMTKQKKNEFSQYRERLRDKGLIDVSDRGLIKLTLPRFDVFVEREYSK